MAKYEVVNGVGIIPEGVTAIDNEAFYDCESLISVVIPSSVTKIGVEAFRGCTSLTSLVIEEGVTEIGYSAFYDCTSLTNVVIPSSVTEIGTFAFAECTSLTSVVISEGVTKIGSYDFYDCTSLTSVVIPSSVTEIDILAFGDCTSLTSVVISEGVTKIGCSAFEGCTSLTSVVIPSSVTEIGGFAFDGCDSIKVINVPAKKKNYYANLLPEELHSLIVEMDSIINNDKQLVEVVENTMAFDSAPKKTKGRDVSYGIWRIVRTEDNRTEVYKNNERCPKSAPALREICEELGIEVNPKATTEDLRNKVQKAVLELAQYPIFDFKFKKVDWELNEENIEERREEIDFYGAIYVRGISENGDFDTRVLAGCDIADGLYDAMDVVEEFINDDWDEVEVYYTTDCDMYGLDDYDSEDQDNALGSVLSSYLGDYSDNYSYDINIPAICRFVCEDFSIVWITSDCGYYDYDFDYDVDALIAYKKR